MDIASFINQSHINALREITKPLFDLLGATYFEFYRVYEDGGRIILSTHPDWDIHFFKHKYFECTPFENSPNLYKPGYKLWDACPASDAANISADKVAKENFYFDHGFSILKIHEGYMDLFELATTPGNESINSTYLANIPYIEKFISYFLREFSPIIYNLEKNKKIYLPFQKEGYTTSGDSILRVTDQDLIFNQLIDTKANSFYIDDKLIKLSKREMQCLKGIIKGKSAKKIAKDLSLSPKTVESYIENLKIKTGYQDRAELIQKLLDYETTRSLLI